jgi:hypothetical protein
MDKQIIQRLDSFFENADIIDRADIISVLKDSYPKFDPANVSFYFWDLKKAGLFYSYDDKRVRRIGSLKDFFYEPDSFETTLWKNVLSSGMYYPVCLYSSSVFNEFISLQILRKYYFIEAPKEAFDSIADGLAHLKKETPFLFSKDFSNSKILWSMASIVIVSPLVVGAPLNKTVHFFTKGHNPLLGVVTPTLEKLLVDAYCDHHIINLESTGQIVDFYHVALSDYMINFRTLFSYAKKRNVYLELQDFIRVVVRFDLEKGRFFDD